VRAQRYEIGALRALGYAPGHIVISVLLVGLALVVCSVVPAAVIAIRVRDLFATAHGSAIGMPPMEYVAPIATLVTGTALALAVVLGAGLGPALRIARLAPHEAIRPQTTDAGLRIPGVVRLCERLARRTASGRYAVRELARRPWLALATGTAIAAATGGAIAFRVSSSSMGGLVDRMLARDRWDAAVDFRVPLGPVDVAAIAATPGLRSVEPILRGFVTVSLPDGPADYVVTGLAPDAALRRLHVVAGRGVFSGPDAPEAILSRGWGAARGVHAGDRLRVSAAGGAMTLEVVGLLNDVSLDEINVPLHVAQALIGKPQQASGLLAATDRSIAAVRSVLFQNPNVAQVSTMGEVVAATEDFVHMLKAVTAIGSWIQIAVAVLLLFSSLYMSFLERRGDYGLLQTMGYGHAAVTGMVMSEAIAVGVPALVAGVPVGIVFAIFLNAVMSDAWVEVPFVIAWRDVAWVLAHGLVLLPVAALPALRTLFDTDLPGLIRARGFG